MRADLNSFWDEYEKLALKPMIETGTLQRAADRLRPEGSALPSTGTFRIRDELKSAAAGDDERKMTRAKWMQTLKDVPVVIGGTALGYGIGKTLTERTKFKHAPLMGALAGGAASMGMAAIQAELRRRREKAEAEAKAGDVGSHA